MTQIRSAPAVWVAPRAESPRSSGLALPGSTPNTALLLYAKGLSSYTIEIVAGGSWTTPIDPGWNDLFGHQTVELQYGVFAGRTARTWYGDGPAAAVWNDDDAVRVTGASRAPRPSRYFEGLEL